jgi:seryl-tRNA synthetase
MGRMIIAIIENFQQADGSVRIPEVLQATMRKKEITKK